MTGITVIGTDGQDKLRAVFGSIAGLFIDKQRNTLYAIDESDDGSIHMFSLNETPPMEIFVGLHLYKPTLIYVDENDVNGPTMYITFPDQHRVVKWAHEAISGVTILDNCLTCTGVWLDKDKNVHVSETVNHRVIKWSPQTNLTTNVAGQYDESGSDSTHLNDPNCIYVDQMNEGITVADSSDGTAGWNNASLVNPEAVRVDEKTKVFYVVDTYNNRIQRWLPGASEGETIVGGRDETCVDHQNHRFNSGSKNDQLSAPRDLAFDKHGHLYVSDVGNIRVQMFALIDNQPCSSTSTG
ncbi:unnamed protein product [Rotaria sp. Silwood1]|nr:unnamed protein product [Rotaria sp. Silwood1]CAF4825630.1 unnamed protein product [Rotaria sp. Silwood1]